MVNAMVQGKTIVEYNDQIEASKVITAAWEKLERHLK